MHRVGFGRIFESQELVIAFAGVTEGKHIILEVVG